MEFLDLVKGVIGAAVGVGEEDEEITHTGPAPKAKVQPGSLPPIVMTEKMLHGGGIDDPASSSHPGTSCRRAQLEQPSCSNLVAPDEKFQGAPMNDHSESQSPATISLTYQLWIWTVDFELLDVDKDPMWKAAAEANNRGGGDMKLPIVIQGNEIWWGTDDHAGLARFLKLRQDGGYENKRIQKREAKEAEVNFKEAQEKSVVEWRF